METKEEWTIEFGCWFRGQKIKSQRRFFRNILGEDSLGRFVLYYYYFSGTWWVSGDRKPKENVFYGETEHRKGHVVLSITYKGITGLAEIGNSAHLSDINCCACTGGPRGAIPRWRSGRAAVRRYPLSKVRSSGCALLEQPWSDTPHPIREKQVRW